MKLRFLQWNVLYKENPDNIVIEIQKSRAQIIAAQEFIQNSKQNLDTAKYIANKLSFNYFYQTADTWNNGEDKKSQGNAIFSQFPIIKSNFSYLQKPKHNPVNALEEGRVYLEATLKINKKKITIGTTHLTFTPHFKITPQRKTEADNLINIIKNKKINYIFSADLNATPNSYVIQQLEKYLKHVGPTYSEKTFANQSFNYRDIFQVENLDWRLDYIFATNDLIIKKAQIIPSKYSDHLPILTEFEF